MGTCLCSTTRPPSTARCRGRAECPAPATLVAPSASRPAAPPIWRSSAAGRAPDHRARAAAGPHGRPWGGRAARSRRRPGRAGFGARAWCGDLYVGGPSAPRCLRRPWRHGELLSSRGHRPALGHGARGQPGVSAPCRPAASMTAADCGACLDAARSVGCGLAVLSRSARRLWLDRAYRRPASVPGAGRAPSGQGAETVGEQPGIDIAREDSPIVRPRVASLRAKAARQRATAPTRVDPPISGGGVHRCPDLRLGHHEPVGQQGC